MTGTDGTDSAGVPWAGRSLTPQPFAGDDGSADPALAAALAATGGEAAPEAVVAAFAAARVFVPILAVLGEGEQAQPADGDKNADMALMTIEPAAGTRLLPCFTSVGTLAAWNARARPVPVEAARAAQAAVLEECTGVVIDPGGPVPCSLDRPLFWAVAQGREWVRPAADPQLRDAVAAVLSGIRGVVAHRCDPDPGHPAGLVVTLGLPPGLPPSEVTRVTSRAGDGLGAHPLVAERVTGVRLVLRAARPEQSG